MFSWRYIKDKFDNTWNHWIPKYCRDESHSPPNMMVVIKPFIHVCPSCGKSTPVYPPQKSYL